jgi:hypothetical protein
MDGRSALRRGGQHPGRRSSRGDHHGPTPHPGRNHRLGQNLPDGEQGTPAGSPPARRRWWQQRRLGPRSRLAAFTPHHNTSQNPTRAQLHQHRLTGGHAHRPYGLFCGHKKGWSPLWDPGPDRRRFNDPRDYRQRTRGGYPAYAHRHPTRPREPGTRHGARRTLSGRGRRSRRTDQRYGRRLERRPSELSWWRTPQLQLAFSSYELTPFLYSPVYTALFYVRITANKKSRSPLFPGEPADVQLKDHGPML